MCPVVRASAADRVARAIRWLLGAMLATPLIVTPSTLYPFQTGKGIALRILIELAAALFLWLAIADRRFRPRVDRLFWSVLVCAGVMLMAAVLGVDAYRSWWGDLERLQGVFGLLHGVALFVIASSVLRERDHWMTLFRVSLVVSAGVLWYALAQLYPWARWIDVEGVTNNQPGSTFGYASFLATYGIFQVFFAAFLFVMERTRAWRIAAGAGIMLNLLLVALTAIRGAQVGLLAAIGVGAIVILSDRRWPKRVRVGVAVGLVVCAVGVASVRMMAGSDALSAMPRGLQRLATMSLNDTTAQTRLIALRISMDAVVERPWLGWGPENFGVAFGRHFDPALLSLEDAWFDRPHNHLAEVAVHGGLLALAAYLALVAFALQIIGRRVRHAVDRPGRAVATLALMLGVAYGVQNLFLFDTAVSSALFFLYLAFLRGGDEREGSDAKTSGPSATTGVQGIMLVIGLTAVAWSVWSNVTMFRSAADGLETVKATDPGRSSQAFRRAMAGGGAAEREVIGTALQSLITFGRIGRPEWNSYVDEVQRSAERWIGERRADIRLMELQGKVYNRRGDAYAVNAIRVLRRALDEAPRHSEAMSELGLAYLRRGEVDAGLAQFRAIVALNDRYAKGHWILGVALTSQNRFDEGLRELERAIELGHPWDTPSGRGVLKAARDGVAAEVERKTREP